MENEHLVFTFYSTHLALEFENLLENSGFNVKIIPVPRKISSSCGLAGKVESKDYKEIESICEKNGLEYEGIYAFSEAENSYEELHSSI